MTEKRKKVAINGADAEAYIRARQQEREDFRRLEGRELDNYDVAGNEKLAREQVQQAEQDRQVDQQQAEQRRQQEQREQLDQMVERSATQQTEQQQAQREQQEEEMER